MKNKVLIVEDDFEICEILQFYLQQNGMYETVTTHSAETALLLIDQVEYDIILLDIMLPGMDGIELCAEIRRSLYCPIIFISCMNDDDTIVRAMNMGGDDYLVKPFRAPVLLAHIEANLRRSRMQIEEKRNKTICVGELKINSAKHTVTKKGEPLPLSPTEYELLYYLMSHRGSFISFEEIYTAVWQRPSLGDVRTLFVHIRNLRKKIEEDTNEPYYIKTHLREGYIFAAD